MIDVLPAPRKPVKTVMGINGGESVVDAMAGLCAPPGVVAAEAGPGERGAMVSAYDGVSHTGRGRSAAARGAEDAESGCFSHDGEPPFLASCRDACARTIPCAFHAPNISSLAVAQCSRRDKSLTETNRTAHITTPTLPIRSLQSPTCPRPPSAPPSSLPRPRRPTAMAPRLPLARPRGVCF